MNDVVKSMLEGMQEAAAFSGGKDTGSLVHVPDDIDVARIRDKYQMNQVDFANTFGISARTIQEWEQGRRIPTGAARVLLHVIDHEPEAVIRALSHS